jgi:hypothetical protein
MTAKLFQELEILGQQYRVYAVSDGSVSSCELRPIRADGTEEDWGHASSLLDDHSYDYYAGDSLFRRAVDTAKEIAQKIGAAFSRRTWIEGQLERIERNDDWRDHLNGQPIYNGDLLELETLEGWVSVQYESHRRVVSLAFDDGSIRNLEAGMRFRWTH